MTTVLAIAAGLLGLLPFVFSPTRTFARGGTWRFVGAAVIVAAMMSLFFSMRDLGGPVGADDGSGDASAQAQLSAADMKALKTLFGDDSGN